MECERCGERMRVLESRPRTDGKRRRRRECIGCGWRKTTIETGDVSTLPIQEDHADEET
jgi:transcriptional regulator NrdR family protein